MIKLKNSSIGIKQQSCCLMPIELFFNFIMGEQVTFWVSEWLLFNSNWAIFQPQLPLNNNQSLTQKVTCSPMIKMKNSSIGIKQQSHTHSKSNLFSHDVSNISTLSWENKLCFEWVSDCCLKPSEQYFNFIMGEQVTFWVSDCCLMPIELFFN
jgi:hypothetical protein